MTETTKTAKRAGTSGKASQRFSEAERAAMKERARELKAASRLGPEAEREHGVREVLAKIAEMPEPDRLLAERIHELVTASAPTLMPRTYYGMPAYAKDGKIVCFFKPASKFKERYSTFGFEQKANLDEGSMWPVSYALTRLSAADEDRIAKLVRKGAS